MSGNEGGSPSTPRTHSEVRVRLADLVKQLPRVFYMRDIEYVVMFSICRRDQRILPISGPKPAVPQQALGRGGLYRDPSTLLHLSIYFLGEKKKKKQRLCSRVGHMETLALPL